MENIEFICFTSPLGGCGCSSAAWTLGRIASKIFKRKVLIISLESLKIKLLPRSAVRSEKGNIFSGIYCGSSNYGMALEFPLYRDEFGVSYMASEEYFNPLCNISEDELNSFFETISSSNEFDLVILDIPLRRPSFEKYIFCCEKAVIISGYIREKRWVSDDFLAHLESDASELKESPVFFKFAAEEEKESFTDDDVDIHGQFGAEVRELADELFTS